MDSIVHNHTQHVHTYTDATSDGQKRCVGRLQIGTDARFTYTEITVCLLYCFVKGGTENASIGEGWERMREERRVGMREDGNGE